MDREEKQIFDKRFLSVILNERRNIVKWFRIRSSKDLYNILIVNYLKHQYIKCLTINTLLGEISYRKLFLSFSFFSIHFICEHLTKINRLKFDKEKHFLWINKKSFLWEDIYVQIQQLTLVLDRILISNVLFFGIFF